MSLLFAGVMACSVMGSGVTTFAADNDSHINLALFTYIEGMDPATDWCGWNLTRCGVGETLVTVNENMEIVGQLADEWEQTDDTTYRFHIRQGVKFSNGTELTPEIVKDSIQRSIDNNSRGGDLKIASIDGNETWERQNRKDQCGPSARPSQNRLRIDPVSGG